MKFFLFGIVDKRWATLSSCCGDPVFMKTSIWKITQHDYKQIVVVSAFELISQLLESHVLPCLFHLALILIEKPNIDEVV